MIRLNKAFASKRCTQDHIAVQNFAAIDRKVHKKTKIWKKDLKVKLLKASISFPAGLTIIV